MGFDMISEKRALFSIPYCRFNLGGLTTDEGSTLKILLSSELAVKTLEDQCCIGAAEAKTV